MSSSMNVELGDIPLSGHDEETPIPPPTAEQLPINEHSPMMDLYLHASDDPFSASTIQHLGPTLCLRLVLLAWCCRLWIWQIQG
ncbi:hypothetical protein ACJZ2D_014558 [Fusarium nematophilum]